MLSRPCFVLLGALVSFGCQRKPAFCAQDLSGRWVKAFDEVAAFQLSERDGTIRGEATALQPVTTSQSERTDGLPVPVPGGAPYEVRLERTRSAVRGTIQAITHSASGKQCPVDLDVEVLTCNPNEIVLHGESTADVADDCTKRVTAANGSAAPRRLIEFTLRRKDATAAAASVAAPAAR